MVLQYPLNNSLSFRRTTKIYMRARPIEIILPKNTHICYTWQNMTYLSSYSLVWLSFKRSFFSPRWGRLYMFISQINGCLPKIELISATQLLSPTLTINYASFKRIQCVAFFISLALLKMAHLFLFTNLFAIDQPCYMRCRMCSRCCAIRY